MAKPIDSTPTLTKKETEEFIEAMISVEKSKISNSILNNVKRIKNEFEVKESC